MNTNRVSLYLPKLSGGGAERVFLLLAHELVGLGLCVDLVVLRAVGPLVSQVPAGVRLVEIGADTQRESVGGLVKYLRRERPIALVTGLDECNIVAVLAKRLAGVPTRIIVTLHNTLSIHLNSVRGFRARLVRWGIRLAYPAADALVAVSAGVADDLAAMIGIPRKRIQVIYNPVVGHDLLERARVSVDHPWFAGSTAAGRIPVLLAVGRLTAQKDFPNLLKAFALLRQRRPARLLILGEGEARPELERLAVELGIADDLQMPGFAANSYAFMAAADALVLSSRWEGLPTVLIEALACGAPIVSTDCPSGPREILADGLYGTLVPIDAPGDLAEAMDRVLTAGRRPLPPESWEPYRVSAAGAHYYHLITGHTAPRVPPLIGVSNA